MSRTGLSLLLTLLLQATVCLADKPSSRSPAADSKSEERFNRKFDLSGKGEVVVIITHASTVDDRSRKTKPTLDSIVEQAKQRDIPVVYLQGNLNRREHFLADKNPTFRVESEHGQFRFAIPQSVVVCGGGIFSNCQAQTVEDILNSTRKQKHLTLVFPTGGIYEWRVGKHAAPVLFERENRHKYFTLTQVFDLFRSQRKLIEYLTDFILEDYNAGKFRNSRIILKLGKTTKMIREGKGKDPNTRTFQFVRSERDGSFNLARCLKAWGMVR